MKILLLNGSPRANGNTAAFAEAFCRGAASAGHTVDVKAVAFMKIAPCIACLKCRPNGKNSGKCVVRDDAPAIVESLPEYDMIVFASPVYYWGLTGQLQALITRFYPYGPIPVKKCALIASAGSPYNFDGVITQYLSMCRYFSAEDLGILTFCGPDQKTEKNLKKVEAFAANL